jgi:hypothetical protein
MVRSDFLRIEDEVRLEYAREVSEYRDTMVAWAENGGGRIAIDRVNGESLNVFEELGVIEDGQLLSIDPAKHGLLVRESYIRSEIILASLNDDFIRQGNILSGNYPEDVLEVLRNLEAETLSSTLPVPENFDTTVSAVESMLGENLTPASLSSLDQSLLDDPSTRDFLLDLVNLNAANRPLELENILTTSSNVNQLQALNGLFELGAAGSQGLDDRAALAEVMQYTADRISNLQQEAPAVDYRDILQPSE